MAFLATINACLFIFFVSIEAAIVNPEIQKLYSQIICNYYNNNIGSQIHYGTFSKSLKAKLEIVHMCINFVLKDLYMLNSLKLIQKKIDRILQFIKGWTKKSLENYFKVFFSSSIISFVPLIYFKIFLRL